MSNWASSYLNKTKKDQLKKRCLYDLKSKEDIDIFQTANPPFPILLTTLLKEMQYQAKVFRNKANCHQQIFTYVLLVLCFQAKKPTCSTFMDYVYELIEKPEFQLIFPKGSELNAQPQIKIKNILSQYLNQLNLHTMSVLKSLNKYPILLQIFVSFCRTLMILGEACNSHQQAVPMMEIYDFLASYFDIEMEIGSNYIFFNEANIYVHQNTPEEIFLIIPTEMHNAYSSNKIQHNSTLMMTNAETSLFSKTKPIYESPGKRTSKSRKNSKKISLQERTDLIEKIKVKIEESHHQLSKLEEKSKFSFNYTESEQIDKSQNQMSVILKKVSPHHRITGSKESKKNLHSVFFELETLPSADDCENHVQKPQISGHYRNRSDHCAKASSKQNFSKFDEEWKTEKLVKMEQLFYRPENLGKMEKLLWCENKKPWVNQNISKQFTSSFILSCMAQPYRSSIKQKKQRARHQRKSTEECFSYQIH